MVLTKKVIYFKFRLNFVTKSGSGTTEVSNFGFVNIIAPNAQIAKQIFEKFCPDPSRTKLIDIKKIGIVPIDDSTATVEPLTLSVNGQAVGIYTGDEKTIDIPVPTKTSQLINDSGFVDSSALDGLEEKVTENVIGRIGDDFISKDDVSTAFSLADIDDDTKIPTVGSVVKYIETCYLDSSTIQQIIDGVIVPPDPGTKYVTELELENYARCADVSTALDTKSDKAVTYTQTDVDELLNAKQTEIDQANNNIFTLKGIVGDLGGNVVYGCPLEGTFNSLMKKNGTVKLEEDLTTGRFGPTITAKNNVKLNLNGHKLTFNDLSLSSSYGGIMSRGTQEITISGTAATEINALQGICIEANGADSVINLTGSTTYVTDRPNGELIYCYSGTINISNGTFKNNGSKYLLNCYDANYAAGKAKIIVTGGKFYDFNPADNQAEGEHTSFVAEGYHVETSTVVEEGIQHTVYNVKKD